MALVVIGGHSKNVGKTSVICSLIAALPERNWTAIKITHHGHRTWPAAHEPQEYDTVECLLDGLDECEREGKNDTSRYLQAGALRSLWMRVRQGQLEEAIPRIRAEMEQAENVLIESNSILHYLKPDVFASVLDPAVADFKLSAARYLYRADALLVNGESLDDACWSGVSLHGTAGIPRFRIAAPDYSSSEFTEFVAGRLDQLASSVRASM